MLSFAEAQKQARFVIVGFVRAANEAPRIDPELMVSGVDGVLPIARATRADEIVVAAQERRGLPMDELLDCRMHGISVSDYHGFFERESGRVELEGLHPSWLVYCDGFRLGMVQNVIKRGLDIVLSLAFLVLTLPLLIATAIAVRLESRGPVFYRQERVGFDGRPYGLFKFRSMRVDAESDGVPRWAAVRDDRVTRVGAFIRTTRIDELPQIFCVLRGDMSFIGPRPERPYFVDELLQQLPYYGQRHRVRPGITVRRQRRGCPRQAHLRSLLHQELQHLPRHGHPDRDHSGGALAAWRALARQAPPRPPPHDADSRFDDHGDDRLRQPRRGGAGLSRADPAPDRALADSRHRTGFPGLSHPDRDLGFAGRSRGADAVIDLLDTLRLGGLARLPGAAARGLAAAAVTRPSSPPGSAR